MALSPEFVSNKDLRKEAGNLNKCGVLKEKISMIGMKLVDLYDVFLKSVEGIPEGSEEEKKIPASVIEMYNAIVDGKDPSKEEQEKMAADKKKKEPKPRGPNFESQAYDLINSMVGKSEDNIKKAAIAMYTVLYAKKDPPKTDIKFIEGRTDIYLNIAKKKIKKEGAPVVAEEEVKA